MPSTMSPRAKTRMISIIVIVFGLSLAAGLALYGLSGRITYFYSPSEIASGQIPAPALAKPFRLGGMVADDTYSASGTNHNFVVTDYTANINVTYQGILPALFREGQGVVANGTFDPTTNTFTATNILARHDENYMPPDVKKILERSGQ